jgi:hypothetical protein
MGRLEEAEEALRQLQKEIFHLRKFGRDRFADGDVIRFTKSYDSSFSGGKRNVYTYAAIRAGGFWWTTAQVGAPAKRLRYDDLIQFIIQHPAATDVQVATHWVDVTEAAETFHSAEGFVMGPYPYTKTGEPEYSIAPKHGPNSLPHEYSGGDCNDTCNRLDKNNDH